MSYDSYFLRLLFQHSNQHSCDEHLENGTMICMIHYTCNGRSHRNIQRLYFTQAFIRTLVLYTYSIYQQRVLVLRTNQYAFESYKGNMRLNLTRVFQPFDSFIRRTYIHDDIGVGTMQQSVKTHQSKNSHRTAKAKIQIQISRNQLIQPPKRPKPTTINRQLTKYCSSHTLSIILNFYITKANASTYNTKMPKHPTLHHSYIIPKRQRGCLLIAHIALSGQDLRYIPAN